MTSQVVTAAVPARPGAPPERAARIVTVGAVVWLSSELMFFGGLFGAFLTLRGSADGAWPPRGAELDVPLALVLTALLVVSSVTVHLGVSALRRDDVARFRAWFVVTVVLGAAFLVGQAYEWSRLGFGVADHAYGTSFFTITGFHGLHLFAGVLALAVMVVRSLSAGFDRRRLPAAEVTSYYWHFVDGVWIAVLVLLYLVA